MQPKPRDAKLLNCVIIPLYGSCFLPFLMSWMDRKAFLFVPKVLLLFLSSFLLHFLIMYRRQEIYRLVCRVSHRKVRFFEFPFFVIVNLLYTFAFLVAPFLLNLIRLPGGPSSLLLDDNLTMYLLFSAGAVLITGAISGFDIYPVNRFDTKTSLQHLIAITRDLMKLSNRILVIVSGSLLVGWAFKKIDLSTTLIYLTLYGVVGFAFGSTAVLGGRVNDLLYRLAELEHEEELERKSKSPT